MKSYKKPVLNVECFTANEFVATCGPTGVTYKFKCDAGGGVYGSVYEETNGIDGLQTGGRNSDSILARYSDGIFGESGYHACNEEHEAASTDPFVNGYYCAKGDTRNPIQVVVWKEPRWWGSPNIHCTINLDQSSWGTAKS